MLVRRLIGREAGDVIDMSAPDAVRAIQGGSVEALSDVECAQYMSGSEKVNAVRALVSVAKAPEVVAAPVKRKGGWPKGKPRPPRKLTLVHAQEPTPADDVVQD